MAMVERCIKLTTKGCVEYYPDTDDILMIRCPKCGKENYAPNVIRGICTWCGEDGRNYLKDEHKNMKGE